VRFNAIKLANNYYSFNCIICNKSSIKCKGAYALKHHSGTCTSCCQKGRPYEHLFNRLKASARNDNKSVSITFDDYLTFVNKNCHYCNYEIDWQEYSRKGDGKRSSAAYFIDRKDSKIGYHLNNLVQCCTRCNRGKNSLFSYGEWYEMTKPFREDKLKIKSHQDWDSIWNNEL
jgi:hypothetical protein